MRRNFEHDFPPEYFTPTKTTPYGGETPPEGEQLRAAPASPVDPAADGAVRAAGIQLVTVIGQIEGHYLLPEGQKATRYEHLIPLLVDAEESPEVGGILLLLNTVGGDVEAGLALAELVAGLRKPTASLILGGGHSIGLPLAAAADRSFIVPSATITLHPVRITGLVLGAPQSFLWFQKMQERITGFVTAHSRISPARYSELLMKTGELATDMGSLLDGRQAVAEGLIDEIGGLCEALAYLRGRMKRESG